ncbi:MAG TPA: hypothetical protein VLE69_00355 [Candidatus Saccharimonadales bacterium]|nr:hypothetical protein [Candidatus Saccharimonadales bacterium]
MGDRLDKIKPASGFSHFIHYLLLVLLPALVFVFVRLDFIPLAVALILLSKWRMFAVKPRHWITNIRANGVDIIVGLSLLIFMIHSGSQLVQLLWAVGYALWLIFLKPKSTQISVMGQALVAQTLGLTAVFLQWGAAPVVGLVGLSWLVCYVAARHFFTAFDEPFTRFLSDLWGYFAAALVWVLSHWLLFYGVIAQPTLLLTVIGTSLGSIYYLEHNDRLSLGLRRQLLFIMLAVVAVVLIFSKWTNSAI